MTDSNVANRFMTGHFGHYIAIGPVCATFDWQLPSNVVRVAANFLL
jgi:hypothetical protein